MAHVYTQLADDALLLSFQKTGDPAAFELLYERHVPHLKRIARRALRLDPRFPNDDLVEDLAERVFMKLHRERNTLAGFDPVCWKFPLFLSLLLKDELRVHWRKQKNENLRSHNLGRFKTCVPTSDLDAALYLAEFSQILRGSEKRYWKEVVLQEPPPPSKQPLTGENKKKLRQRVLRRFEAYWTNGQADHL
jgi:DNA-directed RNA polymerase specialized sigma24 family protein